jgi:hypothetical protein
MNNNLLFYPALTILCYNDFMQHRLADLGHEYLRLKAG